jgi:hypothetical protein
VSAGALLVVLSGGGLALGGVVPGSDGALDPIVSTVTSTASSTISSTESGAGLVPAPQPAPEPVQSTLDGATKAVDDTLAPDDQDPSDPGNDGGATGGDLGSQPKPGRKATTASVDTPSGTTARTVKAPAAHATSGLAAIQGPTAWHGRATAALSGNAPITEQPVTAAPHGAIAPRLLPQLPSAGSQSPLSGNEALPGVLVVLAVTGLAALVASHIGVWQNRLRATD